MQQASNFPTLPRRKRPQRRRVASCLEYDGSGFHGFQRQPDQRTVEGELVRSLVELGLTGGLSFASRTDTGVHARGQVVCFHVDAVADPILLQKDLQSRLPSDIRIRTLTWAPAKFHPRWSAIGKRYVYSLHWGQTRERSWQLEAHLPVVQLQASLDELRRATQLDGFTAAGAPQKPAPPLTSLELRESNDGLEIVFIGPAFARYAIRHMVGCAVEQARGNVPAGTCAQIAANPGPYRGFRAPPNGLVLEEVFYTEALNPFGGPVSGSP